MGNTYTSRPKQRRARKVWDHVTKTEGKEPFSIWWNSTAWNRHGDAWWGWWMADMGGENVIIIDPREVPNKSLQRTEDRR